MKATNQSDKLARIFYSAIVIIISLSVLPAAVLHAEVLDVLPPGSVLLEDEKPNYGLPPGFSLDDQGSKEKTERLSNSDKGFVEESKDSLRTPIQDWGIVLLWYIGLTWAIGMTPPLLIRFVFMRRQMQKGWAVAIVALFLIFNFWLFIGVLESKSKSHFALFLVAYVSYRILRKGGRMTAKKPRPHQKPQTNTGKREKVSVPEEFPFPLELKRKIFEHLLKETKRDEATMLQAKTLSDGNPEKAGAIYYRLRYGQIVESGEIEQFKRDLLKANHPAIAA